MIGVERTKGRLAMAQVTKEQLTEWLVSNGLDEVPGYGHIDAGTLADRMLTTFKIRKRTTGGEVD